MLGTRENKKELEEIAAKIAETSEQAKINKLVRDLEQMDKEIKLQESLRNMNEKKPTEQLEKVAEQLSGNNCLVSAKSSEEEEPSTRKLQFYPSSNSVETITEEQDNI